ncbi:MAG: hypothetical protein CMM84_16295 [Rhodothermaceae bacterium]|nr:hypothetical protein [Rhodothermaceae bacterium]MAQ95076.1 hypothetical protein [Rhodothermaceae bacterium]MBC12494.1 hypothetical protein [Rhodothermaceae bacterium]
MPEIMDPDCLTAHQIDGFLSEKYAEDPWFYFSEVPERTGYHGRSIDGLAVNVWPSQFAIVAFEVKVSRGDFLREIADPGKRAPFVANSTEFYFVTPNGLVQPEEVPVECGLMWVQSGGRLVRKKIAQQRRIESVEPSFLASLIRQQGRGRAYDGRKLFKYAGREMTREELSAECEDAIRRGIEEDAPDWRRQMREEVAAKWEKDNAHRLAISDAIAAQGRALGFPYIYPTSSPEGIKADVTAWLNGLQASGMPLPRRAALKAARDKMNHALAFLDEA